MKQKNDPSMYAAMRAQGLSNRLIAQALGVNESTVRRALKDVPAPTPTPGVRRRVTIIVEEFPE